MGNIYGVANPLAIPAVYVPAADVALPAGTETTIVTTGAIAQIGPGNYYPEIDITFSVLNGATVPTALTAAFKIGAGSDVDSFEVAPAALVAADTESFTVKLIGASSGTAWVGAGSTINITLLAAGNAATLKAIGTRAIVALKRGPD